MNKNIELKKYFGQEEKLPEIVREQISEEIILYAYSDLNNSFHFSGSWIVVTETRFYLVHGKSLKLEKDFAINKISRVIERKSSNGFRLKILTADDLPPLLEVYYTGKQKVMMGKIKFLLEKKVKGENLAFDINPDKEYHSNALSTIIEVQSETSVDDKGTLLRLLSYLAPYKRKLIIGTIGAAVSTLVSLLPAYFSGKIIDDLVKPYQDGVLPVETALKSGWVIMAALGATFVIREIFSWMRLNQMSILGEGVARDLRVELYAHLQSLDMDFFSKKQTGSIISRVSSDTDRVWDFIAFGVVEVGIALITLLSLSAVLITMDYRLGLIMSVPVPLLLFSIYKHGEKMKSVFLKCWRKWANLTNVLSDTIPGMQVVKAFNQHDREIKRFNGINDVVTDQFEEVHQIWTRFWPGLMLSIHLIVLTVWCFALPRLFESGESQLSAGTFVSFLLYMTMFTAPIEIIGQMARMLNRALSSAHRIFEILDSRAKIVNKSEALRPSELEGRIEFRETTFSYDGIRPILKGINFNIEPGEMIGLVGSSGGGKSTITKLISRFYDAQGGSILIDGEPIENYDVGWLRENIGMVLQEPFLFHGTIWENIAYGLPDISKDKIIEAARVANAHEFIMRFQDSYETIIGERGHTLSGGERQRISIARAILHDPKILILDEATSAVDTETERKIQDALDKLVKGRTVLAVAHRLSTLRQADRIFVINKGEVAEVGPHEELLKNEQGHYFKLHNMQKEMNKNFAL
ncbi:hypothetical protein A9Q84_02090 [Halobacteriovorax marinus]|uniref:ABC transporter n=1 Tax=Halobacteriovorax marinus TaxID=97084 RepID=A0A1Y5FCA8_9BACT|nr:hypothetical protein A9Q84_02090 [Halobacteriovorax marinus]